MEKEGMIMDRYRLEFIIGNVSYGKREGSLPTGPWWNRIAGEPRQWRCLSLI